MSLNRIPRANLSEQVAEQVGDMILSGQWKRGDKLPPEAELGKTLGVSRATVREALRALAFVGLVQMRTGQGTYVAGTPPKFMDHLLANGLMNSEKDIRNLTDARMAIEPELAALCAEQATDAELEQLGHLIGEMERTLGDEGEEFLNLDLEFHISIATYSQSEVLAQLLRTIRSLLQAVIKKSAQIPGDRKLAHEGHSRIFEALKHRNPRKARSAMRDHLRGLRERYLLLVRASEATEALSRE